MISPFYEADVNLDTKLLGKIYTEYAEKYSNIEGEFTC